MTFGPEETKKQGARITSLEEFKRCLDYFKNEGYHEIDTARVYCGGAQEAFTSSVAWKTRGLSVATKSYPNASGDHAALKLRETLERSLKELGTDSVDIFYLHAPDRTTPFEETLAECDKLHKESKFLQLGLSNFTAFEVAEVVMRCRAKGWVQPTIYQGKYNALHRSLEKELIPACRRYGIQVVAYNPLAAGLFSGKYANAATPEEGRFSGDGIGALYRARYFNDATFTALQLIEDVARRYNLTMLEVALRWLVHHSALKPALREGDGIVVGVSCFEQLHGNLRDIRKGPLPEEVVRVLDVAGSLTGGTEANYWHGEIAYNYVLEATTSKVAGRVD